MPQTNDRDRSVSAGEHWGSASDRVWLRAALDGSSDLSVVMAPDTTLLWASSAVQRLLGYSPSEMEGRSMVEFVHPDDLDRAAEVIGLVRAGRLEGERQATPALYRVRHSDGSWVPLEINTSGKVNGSDDLLLVARQTNDLVLGDRLLEAVTGEVPFDDQVALVVELGRWRHGTEGYAVIYREEGDGPWRASSAGIASALLTEIGGAGGPSPWERAMAGGTTVVVEDLDDRAVLSASVADAARAGGFVTVMAVPVPDPANAEGACIVIWLTPEGPDLAGHRYPVENMVRSLSLILQWRQHLRSLERAARVDDLTGLATRARFFELASERAKAGPVTVLYVDLDGFKAVNDGHGHAAGDEVLRTVASRMSDVVGPDVLIGRLGGDEFAAVCPAGTSLAEAEVLAGSVVEVVSLPVDLEGLSLSIGASVGVAAGVTGEAIDAVLDRADTAMLGSKATGRGAWRSAPRN